MAGALIALLLVAAAFVWVGLRVLRELLEERERIGNELHDDHMPTLEYVVPTGQDPVVILAALERARYTATVDPHGAHQVVMVACPDGLDRQRAHVRSVIESASATAPDDGVPLQVDVRFRDES